MQAVLSIWEWANRCHVLSDPSILFPPCYAQQICQARTVSDPEDQDKHLSNWMVEWYASFETQKYFNAFDKFPSHPGTVYMSSAM